MEKHFHTKKLLNKSEIPELQELWEAQMRKTQYPLSFHATGLYPKMDLLEDMAVRRNESIIY